MDSYFCHYFEERVVDELVDDDQIQDDYDEVIDDPRGSQGRLHYFHCLIDRRQQPADSIKLQTALLEQKLFYQSSSYTPSDPEIPEWITVNFKSRFVNFTESLLRDELQMNRNKFLIVAKFGIFATMHDDDGEVEEDGEEIRSVSASKSSIEALEKISGLDCGEFAICLEKIEEEELAKRMFFMETASINGWTRITCVLTVFVPQFSSLITKIYDIICHLNIYMSTSM